MILADLKLKDDNKIKSSMNCSADFYEQDRSKYTVQEIGDMPHSINMQKNSNTLKNERPLNPVDIKKFNDRQMVAYQIVQDHFTCTSENKEQPLMMITGLGGSGKNYVIQALRWLKTVSNTYIWIGRYNHCLSFDATIMVSKNCPIIGEHVVIICLTQ